MLALAVFMPGDTLGDAFTHTWNQCLVDRTFLELECRRSHGSHVALSWKNWLESSGWTQDSQEAWHSTQEIWSGSFREPIDWASDKPNIKWKSLCSSAVIHLSIHLRTEFKGLRASFFFFPWRRVRQGGDYVGENMSILLLFFPPKDSLMVKDFVGPNRNREKHD